MSRSWPRLFLLAVMAGVSLVGFSSPANAAGTGSITGILTHDSIGPLEDICVDAYDSSGVRAGYDFSDADGTYRVGGLASGDYRIRFRQCHSYGDNVAPEFYDDKDTLAEATPVSVTDGTNTPDIDAELATGGSISGTLSGFGVGEPYYCMASAVVYDSDGEYVGTATVGFLSGGEYKIDKLRTGDYKVKFTRGCLDPGNPQEPGPSVTVYYDGKQTLAEATPVSVTAGSDTPGIDSDLMLDPGNVIAGTLTDSAGDPLASSCAIAYNANGIMAGMDGTDSDGNYEIYGLDTGDYRLEFRGCDSNAVTEFYDDQDTLAEATPVSFTKGSDTTGIDAQLAKGGSISGTITDIKGAPLGGICVEAFDANGARAAFAISVADGSYALISLTTDSYRLKFSDCLELKPFNVPAEFYDDKPTLAEAIPVAVTVGSETPGINARMATPGGDSTVYKATISKVKVTGPAKAKRGKVVTFKVRITNSGNAQATGTRLKVKGRGVSFNTWVGTIPPGTTRTVTTKLRPKKPGKATLTFTVTSSNAGSKSAKRHVTVRK